MDVYEAVTSRRAVRGFTDEPVSQEVPECVLSAAAWSPSGSNLQPWNIYVVTGAPLADLKKRAVERVTAGVPWDEREHEMYPPAGPQGELRPYGPRPARRDGHVRRRLVARLPEGEDHSAGRSLMFDLVVACGPGEG